MLTGQKDLEHTMHDVSATCCSGMLKKITRGQTVVQHRSLAPAHAAGQYYVFNFLVLTRKLNM